MCYQELPPDTIIIVGAGFKPVPTTTDLWKQHHLPAFLARREDGVDSFLKIF